MADVEWPLGTERIAEIEAAKAAAALVVWRVDCINRDETIVVHLFSNHAKAMAFCDVDGRSHVICEQIVDAPETHEGRRQ